MKKTETVSKTKANKETASSGKIVVTDSLSVKYRPKTIEDMIGNASAKTMIQGMLKNKRFPNTILLHGGTGMGKTTTARMLARYINCATGDACGTCPSCRAGDASPDIVEMNMAETRGIDDIRNLIGKSKLAPRFNQRVFILDELHQCFPPDAEIQMWDYSYKKISDLIVGDRVLSFNHETNQVEISVVENTYELTNSKEIVTVEVEGGSQNCTADHKWWSVTRQCYVEAKDLIEGEEILIIEANKDT